jgi:alpha-methylacyl-CoA racemase
VTPVLTFAEAAGHPHLAARGTVTTFGGVVQAAPAPRFSRSTPDQPTPPPAPGADDTAAVLRDWGLRDWGIAGA